MTELPQGFTVHVANMGIKDDTDDVMVLNCETSATAAGVFTRSRFAGPSVTISRQHISSGTARAVTVISKNANVATGD
ncbi:MAG: bifunctional ornithine acetyltransferase/N-acetylglutamate synthase, partial [Actinomycetota bacterium]|nr:bifunctional ornithine acetyltransferase/N-acetylglutamate synthase [Actinomycetota bacterium]